jgi:hypothetical protein
VKGKGMDRSFRVAAQAVRHPRLPYQQPITGKRKPKRDLVTPRCQVARLAGLTANRGMVGSCCYRGCNTVAAHPFYRRYSNDPCRLLRYHNDPQ